MSSGLNLSQNLIGELVQELIHQHREQQNVISGIESRLAKIEIKSFGLQNEINNCKFQLKSWCSQENEHEPAMEDNNVALVSVVGHGSDEDHNMALSKQSNAFIGQTASMKGWKQEYVLNPSMWEIAFLVWLKGVIIFQDSLLVTLCFFANLALQGFVCYVLQQSAFLEVPLTDEKLQALRVWRWTDAHSDVFVDPSRTASLASRVCSDDFGLTLSTNQQNLVNSLESYTSSGGRVLAIVVISVMTFLCAAEVRKCMSFLYALLHQPLSRVTRIIWEDGEWHIARISYFRVLLGFVVLLMRLGIAGFLIFYGCRWLAYTDDVEELLLNASALGFLIEIDELLYAAFVPFRLAEMLRNFRPLKMPANSIVIQYSPVFLLVMASLFVLASDLFWLAPVVDVMEEATSILCSGERDFVYGFNAMAQIMWTPTQPFGYLSSRVQSQNRIVKAIVDSEMEFVNQVAIARSNPHTFKQFVTFSRETLAQQYETCSSYEGNSLGMVLWAVSGWDELNNASLVTCKDVLQRFPDFCIKTDDNIGFLMRFECPHECGCDDVSSGLFHLGTEYWGCPLSSCRKAMQISLQNASRVRCKDQTPKQLRGSTEFERFLDLAWRYLRTTKGMNFTRQPQFLRLVNRKGCSALADLGGDTALLCSEFHHGASFYCPETCGCSMRSIGPVDARDRCPTSCFESLD